MQYAQSFAKAFTADLNLKSLDRPISYKSTDILDYAPIKNHLNTRHMTVSELNAASIQYSDNRVENLLLDKESSLEYERIGRLVAQTRWR
jgi:beta-lactamase class A